jgi:hypothetical protein
MTRKKHISDIRSEDKVAGQYGMDGQPLIKMWDRPIKILRKGAVQ